MPCPYSHSLATFCFREQTHCPEPVPLSHFAPPRASASDLGPSGIGRGVIAGGLKHDQSGATICTKPSGLRESPLIVLKYRTKNKPLQPIPDKEINYSILAPLFWTAVWRLFFASSLSNVPSEPPRGTTARSPTHRWGAPWRRGSPAWRNSAGNGVASCS